MTIKRILDRAENLALPIFAHRNKLFHELVTSQQKTKMPIITSATRTNSNLLTRNAAPIYGLLQVEGA